MSNPHLPPEMLDCVIDLLHDETETLKQCCLVSKSWVPRTRNNLFADINFRSESELESWKKTFPDVANSPACQTRTLTVGCPWLVTASDAEEGGWIRAFSGVSSLHVGRDGGPIETSNVSLTPFYKFSPSLKSLRVGLISLPYPQVFDLICSFPLLEDFTLMGYNASLAEGDSPDRPQAVIHSSSPALTGTLGFHILGRAESTVRRLLELPNGLHFRKLELSWVHLENLWWITELVVRCSHTLESLDVARTVRLKSESSVDLSKATKLRDLVFRPKYQKIEWITAALRTITPEHRDLQQITIHVPHSSSISSHGPNILHLIPISRQWSDLDHLLVQLWESRSVRLRLGCAWLREEEQYTDDSIERLLPEIMKRGIADLVEYQGPLT